MTTPPMRIVHCVRAPVGGIFRHVRDLARCQEALGHKVGLICDSTTGGAFEDAQIEELRSTLSLGLTRFPMRRQLTVQDFSATLALYRHIRDLKPTVLHGHGAKGGAYARLIGTYLGLRGQKPARIYSPHGGSLHYHPHRLEGRVYHTLERLLGRITDGLIFVSDYESAAYETKIGSARATNRIVYNGLSKQDFEPVNANEDAADFVFIGMLRDLKGPDLFIEALYNLRLRLGRAPSAILVGDGPDEARYREMVEKLGLTGAVTFTGPMKAREAFKLAKTVVIPSRAEAMPYIILETVAAQRPLIATRAGGIPEIFGKFANRLIEPGHITQLTLAMEDALANPEKKQAEAIEMRPCLAETFSTDLMTDRINSVYMDALGIAPSDVPAQQSELTANQATSLSSVYARSSQR
jgi:glycosyltransferase involved in cell wall biosynthesis